MTALTCPVLAIQGHEDAYGTMRQIHRLRELHADTRLLELADCGHSPHLEQPEAVLQAAAAFVGELPALAAAR
ncbi:MAG: alpha/beta hydrolase [Burkholderiaceae bacterium]